MTLPEEVLCIIHKLEEHGYEAYAVGGCVRDTLLGREPEDWDITTSAKPAEVKKIFTRTIDTGIQHGTVTIMIDHTGYEVTTYRIDGEYEDGRHPSQVEFTTNLIRDLERRDFTINAMAYNESTGLVDEFGGIADLHAGIIRCVGDAEQRFDEDALRMLRAVRFSGQLGFQIEGDTRLAIEGRAEHLNKVSAERIRVELTKLLVSQGAGQLREAYETGLTDVFLPELNSMMRCEQNNPHHIYTVGTHCIYGVCQLNAFFQQDREIGLSRLSQEAQERIEVICKTLSNKQHVMLVMAMLLHDVAKPQVMQTDEDGVGHFIDHPIQGEAIAKRIMKRLTFDNETVDVVCRLVRWHEYRFGEGIKSVRRAVSKIGKDIIWMELLVQYADILSQNPEFLPEKMERLDTVGRLIQEILHKQQPLTIKDLAVNGGDLIQAGVSAGPRMGELLGELLNLVLESPEKNNRECLLSELENILVSEERIR